MLENIKEQKETKKYKGRVKYSGIKMFWKILAEKGKIATIIGLILSFPANIYGLYAFITSMSLTEAQLWQIVVINGIGMAWFILPSKVSIKSGKGLEIIVED